MLLEFAQGRIDRVSSCGTYRLITRARDATESMGVYAEDAPGLARDPRVVRVSQLLLG